MSGLRRDTQTHHYPYKNLPPHKPYREQSPYDRRSPLTLRRSPPQSSKYEFDRYVPSPEHPRDDRRTPPRDNGRYHDTRDYRGGYDDRGRGYDDRGRSDYRGYDSRGRDDYIRDDRRKESRYDRGKESRYDRDAPYFGLYSPNQPIPGYQHMGYNNHGYYPTNPNMGASFNPYMSAAYGYGGFPMPFDPRLAMQPLGNYDGGRDYHTSSDVARQYRSAPSVKLLPAGVYNELPEEISGVYKAAGILPISFQDGETKVLLGCEDRRMKRSGRQGEDLSAVWLHFGGKKEPHEEQPHDTALREFGEETAGVFAKQLDTIARKLREKRTPKLWYPAGKYVLYFLEIPYDPTLTSKFEDLSSEAKKASDQVRIQWVSLRTLEEAVRRRPAYDFTLPTDSKDASPHHLLSFFGDMISYREVIPRLYSLHRSTV